MLLLADVIHEPENERNSFPTVPFWPNVQFAPDGRWVDYSRRAGIAKSPSARPGWRNPGEDIQQALGSVQLIRGYNAITIQTAVIARVWVWMLDAAALR